MNITLTQEDLGKLDVLIQDTPFKYANPFYQFFVTKIREEQIRQSEAVDKTQEVENVVKG